MLGALTALEGLLPVLAPGVVLSQLIGPSTSARGHGEHSAPTVPVQLLLAPDVHRLASPQILNRVAGLLVEVTNFTPADRHNTVLDASHLHWRHEIRLCSVSYAGSQGDWRQGGLLS